MNLHQLDLLNPIRNKLDSIIICNSQQAELLCKLIPASCPFARDIKIFNRAIVHIPPLCKINPLYEQLMGLRFRAQCYLAELNSKYLIN
ncbi:MULTISPECIES: Mo-dependent nitrogenase C-terminal domain-containing protein [Nostoc]|uniref:Mo-dependent nitrogenase C-terminal domain-containing protein n=1 Tax=Nostoc paludosum FACHB-159 TaxID=2692908 RepID=A0ABR8KG30_9NOSO|nr:MULTISPECIES: Mo-dependent nitrogenase C-terminal domain-containing protein [Nostoc]MBD2681322.1 Mo-dependent nitrogenase C-terminal domain-containing protein [Nostoc sp. FACHB-857]MBD2737801.1 Mo-dependent nitrogenase C-terminal domain-containing protein [Nostoc paludosum FACHB-159]